MNQQQFIQDIEARAKAAGVRLGSLCISAGVHPTTFSRWKISERNPEPMAATVNALGKIMAKLDEIESRKQAA